MMHTSKQTLTAQHPIINKVLTFCVKPFSTISDGAKPPDVRPFAALLRGDAKRRFPNGLVSLWKTTTARRPVFPPRYYY